MPRAQLVDGRLGNDDRERWVGDRRPQIVPDLDVAWLDPWVSVSDPDAVHAELDCELRSDHPLHGRAVHATARRSDCDDMLFVSVDEVFVVHLSWQRGRETDPRWPTTERYASLADFVARRMTPDHEDFAG